MKNKRIKDKRPFKDLIYCTRCCLPSTSEDIGFDEMGICKACQSSEEKMKIDWHKRQKELKKILEKASKESGNNYDCIIPVSGGKDSTFQTYTIKQTFGLNPLVINCSDLYFDKSGNKSGNKKGTCYSYSSPESAAGLFVVGIQRIAENFVNIY